MMTTPESTVEAVALRQSLKAILDACHEADALGDLPDCIDGTFLDDAAAALELQYPVIWNDEQVELLRKRQADDSRHPYTCGGDRTDVAHTFHAEEAGEEPGLLYPTPRGWRCPACEYRQFWSHETADSASLPAATEEEPIDPLLEEARKMVAAKWPAVAKVVLDGVWDGGDHICDTIAGLRRGIELGKAGQ